MVRRGQTISFRGLSRAAGVSVDFLYRSPLRSRIEEPRAAQQATPPGREPDPAEGASDSQRVRALSAQLRELSRRHREQVAELRHQLAAAQGENLELRRQLGRNRQ